MARGEVQLPAELGGFVAELDFEYAGGFGFSRRVLIVAAGFAAFGGGCEGGGSCESGEEEDGVLHSG